MVCLRTEENDRRLASIARVAACNVAAAISCVGFGSWRVNPEVGVVTSIDPLCGVGEVSPSELVGDFPSVSDAGLSLRSWPLDGNMPWGTETRLFSLHATCSTRAASRRFV